MSKDFKDLKNKELRVKVDQELFDKVNKARGLIPQNTFLAALINAAIDGKVEVA